MSGTTDEGQAANENEITWRTGRELVYFGPAPLMDGEDEEKYNQFLKNIVEFAKPTDIFEMIWVRDAVDMQWEIDRLRRIKVELINCGKRKEKEHVLRLLTFPHILGPDDPNVDAPHMDELEVLLYKGDIGSLDKAAAILAAQGRETEAACITQKVLNARAVAIKIDELECIDRILFTLETRRDNALHQLEERRERVATAHRRTKKHIVDAEYKIVDDNSNDQRRAA